MSRNDLPSEKASNFSARLRETIQTMLGTRGDKLDRVLTLRDVVDSGLLEVRPGSVIGSGAVPLLPGQNLPQPEVYVPDLTPPPTPDFLTATGAISHVLVTVPAATYSQGHGHLRTRLYGVSPTALNPNPVFSDAVEVGQFDGTVWAMASNPSTTWRLWAKWESKDNVLSASPAGGTNGIAVTTGQDVSLLLDALAGQITAGELATSLSTPIGQIPGIGTTASNALSQAQSATAAISTESTTRATQTGELFAKYTVKIDTNGYVSGFGLASTANNATPFSEFAVRADRFYIASPSGPGVGPAMPFIVQTTPTTIGGVSVPVGVYMSDAFIQNGTITNAKIANLAVDDAKIANLSVAKLTAGSIAVGQYAQSTGYIAGSAGWRINGNGTAEFSGVVVRGTVYATAGLIGGITIASDAVRAGQTAWNTGNGFFLQSNGSFSLGNGSGNRLTWDGTNLNVVGGGTFSGDISAASGTFTGNVDIVGDGKFSVRSATSGARMETTARAIKIFDASGVKRVQLGDLTL